MNIKKGTFPYLLNWLRKNIHPNGRLLNAEELCKQVTGEGLNFSYFMQYIHQKYLTK